MVRLKALLPQARTSLLNAFQFQFGAIKSMPAEIASNKALCFNSNLVRLKVFCSITRFTGDFRFNSNLVRLKGWEPPSGSFSPSMFQFQFGAIKSTLPPVIEMWKRSFNSNLARLKAIHLLPTLNKLRVSIPIWCD